MSAKRKNGLTLLANTGEAMMGALQKALHAEEFAARAGWLQLLEARAKILGLGSLILATCLTPSLAAVCGVFAVTMGLAMVSRIPLRYLALREWLPVLPFIGAVAAPALVLTPGAALWHWEHFVVTETGAHTALLLVMRTETCATLALLLVITTPWTALLRGARRLGLPALVVALLAMTLRYIFVLLETAGAMTLARRARLVAPVRTGTDRALMVSSAGVLFEKSLLMGNAVHSAMVARGFRGELPSLSPSHMNRRDFVAVLTLSLVAARVALCP